MSARHPVERIIDRVKREDRGYATPCLIWQGALDPRGYARIGFNGKVRRAHAVMWSHFNGRPVPVGLELDHLCYQPACVEPTHLEPVTHAENMRRAAARRTTCRNGHAHADEAYIDRQGRRCCRACNREYQRARRRR